MRRKRSVSEGVWHLGGKRRRRRKRGEKGVFLPIAGLLSSVAAPLISEIAKLILKKIVGGRRRRRR